MSTAPQQESAAGIVSPPTPRAYTFPELARELERPGFIVSALLVDLGIRIMATPAQVEFLRAHLPGPAARTCARLGLPLEEITAEIEAGKLSGWEADTGEWCLYTSAIMELERRAGLDPLAAWCAAAPGAGGTEEAPGQGAG